MTSLSLHSMTVKASGISIISTSPSVLVLKVFCYVLKRFSSVSDQEMAVSFINLVIKVDGDNFVDARSSCCSITGLAINRLEIIKAYFFSGLLYTEIVLLLFMIHGIKLSLRQLKRILKANGLYRNKNYSRRADVRDLLSAEIENSAK